MRLSGAGSEATMETEADAQGRPPKLYNIRPVIRAYLYGEGMRLAAEHGSHTALEDCEIESTSLRRIRAMKRLGVCGEPHPVSDAISSNYDRAVAQITPSGADLIADILRRCTSDGRILRD